MLATFYKSARKLARPLKRMWISQSNARIFTEVYEKSLWGTAPSGTYYSGKGSYHPAVSEYASLVKSIIKSHNVKSVTEIGCGDFAVARQYVDCCDSYTGIDVVKGLIDQNTRLFANERITFKCLDATKQILDPSDLCIVRQVFQHLSNKDILRILANQRSKLLLITEHLPPLDEIRAINLDKPTGATIRPQFGSGVFIDQPPFNLPATALMDSQISGNRSRLVTWLVQS